MRRGELDWGRQEREIIEHGMTPEAAHLAALSEAPGWSSTPTELASRMGRDRREVKRQLNRLFRAGWVRKGRGDAYVIASERWPEAEADLRRLRALREEAGERGVPEEGGVLEGWALPLPWLAQAACGCEALVGLPFACLC